MGYTFSSILPWVFFALTLVSAIVFMYFRQIESKFRAMGFKAFTGVLFVITAIFSYYSVGNSSIYATMIIIGGLFGVMGDVFLALKAIAPEHFKRLVAVGASYFGLGHIAYFIAIMLSTKFTPWTFVIAIGFALFAYFGLSSKKFNKIGSFKWVCIGYYYILSATLIQAIFGVINASATYAVIFAIGTAFFFISDTLISFMYFGNMKSHKSSIINLSTYYIAQLLIAISILFI